AAAKEPKRAHSSAELPRVYPKRKPAAYKSPAPVVSTKRVTVAAGMVFIPLEVMTTEPKAPRVMTIHSARPEMASTAASKLSHCVKDRISASFTNKTSTYSSMSCSKDARCRSTQNASERESATFRPALRAALAALSMASLALGGSHK